MKKLGTLIIITTLSGCSANEVITDAGDIDIVLEKPDSAVCKYLGEVTGSQGNWFTGAFTPDINLANGARNELRNEAIKLGGNVVYMQDSNNTYFNNNAIGKIYLCSDRDAPISYSQLKYRKQRYFKNYCMKFRDTLNANELDECNKAEPYMREKSPSMFK